jgi:hypothetical protein
VYGIYSQHKKPFYYYFHIFHNFLTSVATHSENAGDFATIFFAEIASFRP